MSEQQKKNKGGRPKKTGLAYFPLHHKLFDHKKVKKAEDLVDPTGRDNIARLLVDKILIRFFSVIFDKGYFITWDEETQADVVRFIGNGMTALWLSGYLNAFLDAELLSRDMFDKHKILTSRGIQENWLSISKMIRRDRPTIEEQYYIPELLPEETPVTSRSNSGKHGNKSVINTNSQGNSHKSTTKPAGDHTNSGFIPEETPVTSRSNASNSMNQGGVSPSTTAIQEYIHNTKEEEERKVPEETLVTSGSNANNSGISAEQTSKFPNIPELLPEETPVTSRSNHIMIQGTTMELYPIETCLWNYFNNRAYERTREQHKINLGVMWTLQQHIQWAEAFNRAKISDGISEMPFNGRGGWLRNFKNWVPTTGDYINNNNPSILYTDKDVKNGDKQQGSQAGGANTQRTGPAARGSKIGGISAESAKQLFDRKRK